MEVVRGEETLRSGPLEIHPGEALVLAAGRPLNLSVREYGVLVALARKADRIVSREVLFETVWGTALRPGDRSVDVYVHKVRAKLEASLPNWRYIHTHVGFGYRFGAEPSELSHHFHTAATGP